MSSRVISHRGDVVHRTFAPSGVLISRGHPGCVGAEPDAAERCDGNIYYQSGPIGTKRDEWIGVAMSPFGNSDGTTSRGKLPCSFRDDGLSEHRFHREWFPLFLAKQGRKTWRFNRKRDRHVSSLTHKHTNTHTHTHTRIQIHTHRAPLHDLNYILVLSLQ